MSNSYGPGMSYSFRAHSCFIFKSGFPMKAHKGMNQLSLRLITLT
ncbi:hypothetical protein HMPREF0290_2121 [Corynebacterium efficiens YS-314]|nr:hypothetical protein HMPREF0290_2121 [Corynebacterium efficiens YS-314]